MSTMKKVKDYLKELNSEAIIEKEAEEFFKSGLNRSVMYKFQDMSLLDFWELCRNEAIQLYVCLMDMPDFTPQDENGKPNTGYIIPYYRIYGDSERDFYVSCNVVFLNDLAKNKIEKYDMEGCSLLTLANLYIDSDNEDLIYEIIHEVMFEAWYMWKDSKFRSDKDIPKEFIDKHFGHVQMSTILTVTSIEKKKILTNLRKTGNDLLEELNDKIIKNLITSLKNENLI